MDSAVPEHLRCPRTRQRRVPDDYAPPFASPVARFDSGLKQVVMAYFGIQHPVLHSRAAREGMDRLESDMQRPDGPRHVDRASYVDEAGYYSLINIAYWSDPQAFDRWFASHGQGWTKGLSKVDRCGTFVEVVKPAVERFETLFSSLAPEGVARLGCGFSGNVQEHGYWGGARDRLPLAQTDGLASGGYPVVVADGLTQRVIPHENLCLIRSGQDWSSTVGEERRMYVSDIEPVLRAGMEFLRDSGSEVGCFANRYVRLLDQQGQPLEKSFGMSLWTSLSALERWSESHPTHLAIFGVAMKYLKRMGTDGQLKLYHEVAVIEARDQFYEYSNCHPQTGMLRSAR